jgi:hypothetical protein
MTLLRGDGLGRCWPTVHFHSGNREAGLFVASDEQWMSISAFIRTCSNAFELVELELSLERLDLGNVRKMSWKDVSQE